MRYRSNVQPGEPASELHLGDLTMYKLAVSDMHNNVYLLRCNRTGAKLLIDAAADAPAIEELLHQSGDGELVGIVTTHKHWDHHRALPDIASHAQGTYAGTQDAGELPVHPNVCLNDGDRIQFGDQFVTAHHVPGHTPGSVVLSWKAPRDRTDQLWTGDTLFPGGVGATTHHPEQSFPELFESVKTKIFGAFDEADVHPGHGDDTTLSVERPHLEEWQERGW